MTTDPIAAALDAAEDIMSELVGYLADDLTTDDLMEATDLVRRTLAPTVCATLADALEAERAKVAAARLEGWRAGRDAAAEIAEGRRNSQSTMHRGSHTAYFMEEERRRECEAISRTIRALPEPKEASHA